MWFQVFRLVALWFTLFSRQNVVNSMLSTIDEVCSKAELVLIVKKMLFLF